MSGWHVQKVYPTLPVCMKKSIFETMFSKAEAHALFSWHRVCTVLSKQKGVSIMAMNENPQHQEGKTTKAIEDQTARLPSKLFLCAALTAMGVSLALKCSGHKHMALFIGQWAAPFLLLGTYNKIVKTHGHDQQDK